MPLSSRFTWEKLSLELELVMSAPSASLMPALIGIDTVLADEKSPPGSERSSQVLNYMNYEIQSLTRTLSELERYNRLNHYFFVEKAFQIGRERGEENLLLSTALENRRGHPLTLALVYLHLAIQIDLPFALLPGARTYLLRWSRGPKSSYIDFINGGKLLEGAALAKVAQPAMSDGDPLAEWPARKILIAYARELLSLYQTKQKLHNLNVVYDILIRLEPSNLKALAERALLKRRMGYVKDALNDLKRYFSFIDQTKAPKELQSAFHELKALSESSRPSPGDLLH